MEGCTDTKISPLCEEKFENLEQSNLRTEAGVEKILDNQEILHNKLFVDNGERSYQTFRRRTETFMNIIVWVVGLVFTGIILTTVGIFVTQALK